MGGLGEQRKLYSARFPILKDAAARPVKMGTKISGGHRRRTLEFLWTKTVLKDGRTDSVGVRKCGV